MTIPTVAPLQQASSTWANQVADAINALTDVAGLYDAYIDKPDGAAVVADSGQTWAHYYSSAAAQLRVVDDRLTFATPTGLNAAGYMEVAMSSPVTRLGAEWSYVTPGTGGHTGAIGLIAWKAPRGSLGGATVEDTNMHLAVTDVGWEIDYWSGGTFTPIALGTFDTPLNTSDPDVVYRVEVVMDGNDVTVWLPDGTMQTATHAEIGDTPGVYAGCEVFQGDTTDDPKVGFVSMWADAAGTAPAARRATLPAEKLYPKVAALDAGAAAATVDFGVRSTILTLTAADVAVPAGGFAAVHANLNVTFTAPPSGKVLVSWSAFLSMTGSTQILWSVHNGGADVASTTVINQQYTGQVTAQKLVTGLTVGTPYTYTWRHWATTGGVAVMKVDNPNGYAPTLTITPVAG